MNSSKTLRVLVVEDDQDTRANLCDLLDLDGHQAIQCESLRQAYQTVYWEQVDAIILDRRLPDGDAGHLLPELRKWAPDCPIVVVTGYPDVDSTIEALRQGAYDYLLKPISPEALRASLRRIAERSETILALRKERDFAESLIETAQAIVVVLDLEGRIVRCNSFLGELTGWDTANLLGRHWLEPLVPPADHHRLIRLLDQIASGATIHDQASRLKMVDGRERLISWSGKSLDGAHKITGLLLVGHDVTDLNEAQQRLVQSERLAAIGQMITGLAHESRNAFQRSQACLETLALEVDDRPAAMELVHRIQRAQDHLHHLYEEVRMYAAPIHLERRECQIDFVWRETWRHLESAWQAKGMKLTEADPRPLPVIKADPHALERIFRNLFENAISAAPEQSEISVASQSILLFGREALAIHVRDQGSGIELSARQRAFDPFFTTKTHGTGLGLPITRRLVEAHGGTIEFGWPNSGTEVIVRLPLNPEAYSPLHTR